MEKRKSADELSGQRLPLQDAADRVEHGPGRKVEPHPLQARPAKSLETQWNSIHDQTLGNAVVAMERHEEARRLRGSVEIC